MLVAFGLVYLPKGFAFIDLFRIGYDNRHPRDQQAKLEGWPKRAIAAHLNGFESFPAFGIAILMAYVAKSTTTYVHALAITYLVARTIYPVLYIANIHALRTIVWTVGVLSVVALMVLASL